MSWTGASRYRYRVTFMEAVTERDEYGDRRETWQPVVTVWGALEGLRGREYFEAAQTVSQSDHRIVIRHRNGIKPTMRAQVGDRVFDIQSVLDRDGRRRQLEIICREVQPWQ